MKTCFKCNVTLPLSEFYRHKMMADGHLNKCKECAKRDVHAHRKANHAKICEYDRERGRNGSRRKTRHDPSKTAARSAVRRAVKAGTLVPAPCEVCGSEKVQAHHDDYSMHLSVRWLCFYHHRQAHGQVVEHTGGAPAHSAG